MRNVAPESPGNAASQNNCPGVKAKPMAGSRATTTDHTIQTLNASSSAGIEIHRLRRAMRRPFACQKAGSSGVHSSSVWAAETPPVRSIPCISGSSGNASSDAPCALRSMCRIAMCIQASEAPTRRNISAKAEV
ncbi:hypothetical protein GALL_437390 [mine drainage metagenome]|uniref:Uncharacterized protein n=1 Tax=mine drainage metagenome TaxID=410659 RepID=A0A1J5Q3X3_9ZZZZ